MKEDKNKLKPMLRAFKAGHITLEFAVDFILRIYSVSKRFNYNSFWIGLSVGIWISLIILWWKL
jgi:hypothetical protein